MVESIGKWIAQERFSMVLLLEKNEENSKTRSSLNRNLNFHYSGNDGMMDSIIVMVGRIKAARPMNRTSLERQIMSTPLKQ